MRTAILATAICVTVLGTIAVAQSVTYDYDPAANFSNYRTYAWTAGTPLTDELDHARVVRAIEDALLAKGVARVDASAPPDVLMTYHASFDGNLQIIGSFDGWGPLNLGGRWGSARVQPVLVGTLVVNMVDARSGKIVWLGRASSDVGPNDKAEARDRKIAKATGKMFKHYPPGR